MRISPFAYLLVLPVIAAFADADEAFDPLARARDSIGRTVNLEASVPSQCYTKTAGISNPCWTCHTVPRDPNFQADWRLQEEYSFSDFALKNHWENLFRDRAAAIARIGDGEALAYIRADNYTPLRAALAARADYPGYRADLDLRRGFDEEGFARDGSGWRALRYKPFPGTFWPTNGSTDDVMIRLPEEFRSRAGSESREVYKLNLAILEAAVAADPFRKDATLGREVEPVDERVAGVDLDGDGAVSGLVTRLQKLPAHYAGDAREVPVHRYLYPQSTEFLHTVRYVDPDAPALLSARIKEVRYSRKTQWLDTWGLLRAQEREAEDKDEGKVPVYSGDPMVGLRTDYGWQLQGFIEDERGRLRLQTEEEHRFCMGCHGALGITVDGTFALARKVPGAAGWRHQDLRGIPDAPQAGHADPEILTYFRRVQGGDELRANQEILARFFPAGRLDESAVRRAAPGGDRDIAFLLNPSRERALLLAKAYMVLVREQSFEKGRDALPIAPLNVHREIENGSTELGKAGKVFRDGRLWLDW
ncbi:MAG TPA: hypothetical protein VGX68_03355 [Thermoanaerobaculia bacterium]|jgi:hypothetical protein|nr:hypothetical protein [Thermoanaerobaculia bacterium]